MFFFNVYLDKMSSSKSHIRTRSKLNNKNEDEENTTKKSTINRQITTTNNSNSNITTKTNRQMIPQQRSSQNQQEKQDEEEKDTTKSPMHTPRHLPEDDDDDDDHHVDYDDVDYEEDDDDDDDELDEAEHENTLPSHSTISTNYGLLNWEQVQRLDELLNKPIAIHGRRPGGGGNGWTGGGGGSGGGGGGGGSNGTVSYSTSPSPQPQYFAPTLHVKLKDFIRELNRRLIARRVNIKDVRINGGVASYVLAKDHSYQFSDIDIIFGTDLLQMSPPEPTTNTETDRLSHQQQQPVPTTTYMGGNSSSPEACFNMSCDIIRDTVFDFLIEHMPAEIERPTRSLVSPKPLSLFY